MKRTLADRVEIYDSETNGQCECGKEVIRVNGSNCTGNTDGTRYRYPHDIFSAWCIFRCDNCGKPIMDTFVSYEPAKK